MVNCARIFIASSSEGLREAGALHAALESALGRAAEVRLWKTEFALSSTYIESLEAVTRQADFVVAVFSGDDRVTSRGRGRLAPRDNVVFELGLFIGALGRARCFFVHRAGADLKLPSDLLAVVGASFDAAPRSPRLAAEMQRCCERIATHVRELGPLDRPGAAALARRAARRMLAAELRGPWWERVDGAGDTALSHFQIEFDDSIETLVLAQGQAFDAEGRLVAHWSGQVIEADAARRRLTYRWTGYHPKSPHSLYHGIGEIEFDTPATAGMAVLRGHGRFWDVPENDPAKTVAKAIELKRVVDPRAQATLRGGTVAQCRALARRVHAQWSR